MARRSLFAVSLASRFPITLGACLSLFMVATGCGGGSGPARAPVSGTITFDGAPLAQGTITFVPAGEGTAASGEIENGQFSISAEKGPSPGRCRVEVVSFQETGKKVPGISDDATGVTAETRQVIPEQFNTKSTLEEQVAADGDNVFELSLTSR